MQEIGSWVIDVLFSILRKYKSQYFILQRHQTATSLSNTSPSFSSTPSTSSDSRSAYTPLTPSQYSIKQRQIHFYQALLNNPAFCHSLLANSAYTNFCLSIFALRTDIWALGLGSSTCAGWALKVWVKMVTQSLEELKEFEADHGGQVAPGNQSGLSSRSCEGPNTSLLPSSLKFSFYPECNLFSFSIVARHGWMIGPRRAN